MSTLVTAVSPASRAPPTKKVRAGGTPQKQQQQQQPPSQATPGGVSDEGTKVDQKIDDAIARRRAQLQQLQAQKNQSTVLSHAQQTFLPNGPPPIAMGYISALRNTASSTTKSISSTTSTTATVPPPNIPLPNNVMNRVRHSDLFPTVPKLQTAGPRAAEESDRPSSSSAASAAPVTVDVAGSAEASLARRLEESFSVDHGTSATDRIPPPRPPGRSRSAPPSRPKPPPPRVGVNAATTATPVAPQPQMGGEGSLLPKAPASLQNIPASERSTMMGPTAKSKTTTDLSCDAPAAAAAAATTTITTKDSSTGMTLSPTEERRVDFGGFQFGQQQTPAASWEHTHAAGRTPYHTSAAATTTTNTSTTKKPEPSDGNAMGSSPPFVDVAKTSVPTPFLDGGVASYLLSPENTNTKSPTSGSTSLTKKDLMKTMQEVAQSLPDVEPKPVQTPDVLLQKQLSALQKEKDEAMTQLAKLNEALQQHQTSPVANLETILQMAERDGEQAALQWARQQVTKKVEFAGVASPMMGFAASTTPPARRKRIVATPYPKRSFRIMNPKEERTLLIKAAKQTVHEYESELAKYVVRRPLGVATERDLWFGCGQLPKKLYEESADACRPTTLEVAAFIKADDSTLVLYNDANVRHQQQHNEDWKEYGNADENPLGYVLYIDKDANELDYCLDDIYLGAKEVREHYSAAVVSMLSALEKEARNPPPMAPSSAAVINPVVSVPEITKAPSKDAGTSTDDLAIPKPIVEGSKPPQEAEEKKKKKKQPVIPDEPSAGILSTAIGMFFQFFFGLIWHILIGIPLGIVRTAIVMAGAILLLTTIRLFWADDNGAQSMGAGVYPHLYNRPGIV